MEIWANRERTGGEREGEVKNREGGRRREKIEYYSKCVKDIRSTQY